VQAAAAFLLLYILCWNLRSISPRRFSPWFPASWNWIAEVTRLDQKWNMFSPYPARNDGWHVVPARLRDGTEVDLFAGGRPMTWEKPSRVAQLYKNHRWWKLMTSLRMSDRSGCRRYYGEYLCRQWNTAHTDRKQVESLRLCFVEEWTLPEAKTAPLKRVWLWEHVRARDGQYAGSEGAQGKPLRVASAAPRPKERLIRGKDASSPTSRPPARTGEPL
jgi:hypothetical protein